MIARIKVIQANDDTRHEYNIPIAQAPTVYIVEVRTLDGEWAEVSLHASERLARQAAQRCAELIDAA